MYHFIALVWNCEDHRARETALRFGGKLCEPWYNPLSTEGLSVHCLPPTEPGMRSYGLPAATGVVLGKLFATDLENTRMSVDSGPTDDVVQEIVRTGGRYLIENYWGGYVALLRDSAGNLQIIRDPSGKIPCYYTRIADVTVLFSDLADLAPLGLPEFTVNWQYLAAFIYSSQLQVRSCGFSEVTELLAGERLEVSRDSVSVRQTSLWDPRRVCRSRRIDSYEEAVTELRRVAQRCIDAWASTHRRILLSLSGGFDSAVVLGSLRNSPAHGDITCVTHFPADPREDERRYARLAAARAGVELLEEPMDSPEQRLDSRVFLAPQTPKPTASGLLGSLQLAAINRLASRTGPYSLWTGQGGDHVFYQTTTSCLSAADYASIHGWRVGLLSAINDAARLSRLPYWSVFKSTWKSRRGGGKHPARTDRAAFFVNPALLPHDPVRYISHPWDCDADDLPPGKRAQILYLAEVMNRHRPVSPHECAPQHHPLLSQPLVELCLQIPTYILVRGGHERALARAAFSDRVPTEIIRRTDKGSIESYITELIRRNVDFIRELLLEGVLAGQGLIVRSELEPYIVDGTPFCEEHYPSLVACIAAEVWARTCSDRLLRV
jgi:asparagine synthase (glutamine-hydrolysing)